MSYMCLCISDTVLSVYVLLYSGCLCKSVFVYVRVAMNSTVYRYMHL